LSFTANGQSDASGSDSITVQSVLDGGSISLSAGNLLEISAASIVFAHLGGQFGALSITSKSTSHAQLYMSALDTGAVTEDGNSVEIEAENGALSLASTNGQAVFETDGLLQIKGDSSTVLQSTVGDIAISSTGPVSFVSNTADTTTNPVAGLTLQSASTTANTIFYSKSDISWEAGEGINFVQTSSGSFTTRQKGQLTVSSDQTFNIAAGQTLLAVGLADYSYIRGFEGVDIVATTRVTFNGIVGLMANDRNRRQINRDKNLIISGGQSVTVLSQSVFFADVDVPNDTRFILPAGDSTTCTAGQFAYDSTVSVIFVCGVVSIAVT